MMLRAITAACLLLAAALAVAATRPAAAIHAALTAGTTTAPALSVSGNHLVDQNGNVVRLTGVNRSGAEYACAEGWGFWDGPTDTDAAVQAMAAWHVNAVRIPLNEDCWLGINGVDPAYSGANYRSAIADYVTRLEGFGVTPILNLHFSAPGTKVPDGQVPMADEDHAPAFWQSLASYFKGDHHLIFDLFNEPYPDSNRDTTAAWQCVRDGGSCPGVSFPTAGMQQLVNVVRAAGATQPLMIAGPQYAGDVDQWLAYEPSDPLHQVVASVHIYEPNWAPCDTQACWDTQLAAVAAKVPVVEGEIGSKDCTASSTEPLLDWSDAHGISYTAWAWNVSSCSGEPSLITNYSGTPTQTYGQGFHDHLAALYSGGTSSPSASPSSSPTSSPTPSSSPTSSASPSPSPTGCVITRDASSPEVVHSAWGAGSVSTASFSPPAGSLIEVVVNALHDRPGSDGVTVTDSRGGIYTAGPHVAGTVAPASSWFFQRYVSSAPGPLTVTAHRAGSAAGTLQLAVRVLDGAARSQSGAAAGTWNAATATTTQAHAITATATGSWVFFAVANGDAPASLTPVSSREVNIDAWHDRASGDSGAIGRQITASPGSQTLGWVAGEADPVTWVAQEVLPAC